MKAAVVHTPGGADVLHLESLPIPIPSEGEVLVRVKAFGLNRSELFTRQGFSPSVKFPRVLGIEVVGLVEQAPGGEFAKGDAVASVMGGMGRQFDGSYAEFTKVPAKQLRKITTALPWEIVGALPEMLQTAWGSLFKALRLQKKESLLVRGGTTSVGLSAATIAKRYGAFVAATTRNPKHDGLLKAAGSDLTFTDDGSVSQQVRAALPERFDKVLDLVGVSSLRDSLHCCRQGGLVCMTGMVGNQWSFDQFEPMTFIPSAVGLTVYTGENADFLAMPFDDLLAQVAAGTFKVHVAQTFHLDQIVEAHRLMESNMAGGKIVVLT